MSEPTWELLGGGGVLGPAGIDYIGDWSAGVTYQPGQIVRFNGVDYLAVNPSLGQVPPLASPYPQAEVCIFDQILGAAAPNFDIPNISPAYSHLRIVASVRGDAAAANVSFGVRFNGDASANYDWQLFRGAGTSPSAIDSYGQVYALMGQPVAGSGGAGLFDAITVDIPDYASTLKNKAMTALSSLKTGIVANSMQMTTAAGFWRNSAAINRITCLPSSGGWAAGSRLTVYAMQSQGQPPLSSVIAPGGIGVGLPSSPANGDLFTLVDSLTVPTYAWNCRYVASITDAYKWLVVGGTPKMTRLETDYPANPAISMTLPNAGYYDLAHGAMNYGATQDTIFSVSLTINGAGSYGYYTFRAVGNMPGYMDSGMGEHPNVLVTPAGATIAQASGVVSTSSRIERRWIRAMPVRLS